MGVGVGATSPLDSTESPSRSQHPSSPHKGAPSPVPAGSPGQAGGVGLIKGHRRSREFGSKTDQTYWANLPLDKAFPVRSPDAFNRAFAKGQNQSNYMALGRW